MKKEILKTIYSVGGFRPFHFLNRKEALILTYHRFSKDQDAHRISGPEFEEQLRYLRRNTNLLPLEELVDCLKNGLELPPNAVAITIDDGYRDAFEIAFPLLSKYEIPATLFVITDFLYGRIWLWTDLMRFALLKTAREKIIVSFENAKIAEDLGNADRRIAAADRLNTELKKMPEADKKNMIAEIAADLDVEIPATPPPEYAAVSWDQAREMDAAGLKIECHTVSHPILTNIDDEQLQHELIESKRVLEHELGRPARHFCYPNGALDRRVRDAVEESGFESAVSTSYGFCDAGTDRFRLRRIDAQPAIANFAQSVSGFERLRERIGI